MAGLNIAVDDHEVVLVLTAERATLLAQYLDAAAFMHEDQGRETERAEAAAWRRELADAVASAQTRDAGDASVRVLVTGFSVCCLPRGHHAWPALALRVVPRGRGRWAVLNPDAYALSRDGSWDEEPRASDRSDAYVEAHSFDLTTALERAREHAPHQTVAGVYGVVTAADILAREAGR